VSTPSTQTSKTEALFFPKEEKIVAGKQIHTIQGVGVVSMSSI